MIDSHDELLRRIHNDLMDGYDEELEMEIEDQACRRAGRRPRRHATLSQHREDRRVYFRELFRLQAELVKLQDWVVATGHKVVIVFEGRDAAGKGGRDQAHHAAPQSAGVPRGGIACAQRP